MVIIMSGYTWIRWREKDGEMTADSVRVNTLIFIHNFAPIPCHTLAVAAKESECCPGAPLSKPSGRQEIISSSYYSI